MEEAPKNSKESSHSAHAKGMNEHNNRQNVNICIRNLNTNKMRQKANEHF